MRLNIEGADERHPVLIETERQLEEYFAGRADGVRVEARFCRYGLST